MKDTQTLQGRWKFKAVHPDGTGYETDWLNNIITNTGKAAVAGLVGNTGSVPAFSYIALGSSSTAVAAADTALNAEYSSGGLSRSSGTVSRVTTTVTNDTLQVLYAFTATGSNTIQEAGLLNNTLASGTSILLSHLLTGALSVVNGTVFTATLQIKFA